MSSESQPSRVTQDVGLTGMFVGSFGVASTAIYGQLYGSSTALTGAVLLFVLVFSVSIIKFTGEPS